MISLDVLSPAERERVATIAIGPHTEFTAIYYLEPDHEDDALLAFYEHNRAAIRARDLKEPNVLEKALSAPRYQRLRYYATFEELNPRVKRATGLPDTDLHTLATRDGAIWAFDSEAYERAMAGCLKPMQAGAWLPPTIDELEGQTLITASQARSAGVLGDLDVAFRYCPSRWQPRYVRTVTNGEEALAKRTESADGARGSSPARGDAS